MPTTDPLPTAPLRYETLERLQIGKPVDRLAYVAGLCRGKRVLDLGCLDATALSKRETPHWLHRRIAAVATSVIGIDNADEVPEAGLVTAPNARIVRGDATDPSVARDDVDIIVAGELIEHLEAPLTFLRRLKEYYPGAELVITTPNGVAFANTLLGTIRREAQHPDHVQLFTFKILNTLFARAGIARFEILPYRFYATEMLLGSTGAKRAVTRATEIGIRLVERAFPLLSFGYVVRARL